MVFTFTGDSVAIFGAIGPSEGPYSVTLDGIDTIGTFNATKDAYTAQVALYQTSNLGPGSHTLALSNSGPGQLLAVDYAVVSGSSTSLAGATTGGASTSSARESSASTVSGVNQSSNNSTTGSRSEN